MGGTRRRDILPKWFAQTGQAGSPSFVTGEPKESRERELMVSNRMLLLHVFDTRRAGVCTGSGDQDTLPLPPQWRACFLIPV